MFTNKDNPGGDSQCWDNLKNTPEGVRAGIYWCVHFDVEWHGEHYCFYDWWYKEL